MTQPPERSRPPPRISVIVPVFNVSDWIAPCLQSIANQTEADFECLIVDDGSTDDSAVVALETVHDDPRFRLIRQPNRGLSAARNAGLDAVAAPLIAFVDGDDRVHPRYLERLRAALEATDASWAACGVRYCYANGQSQTHPAIHGGDPALQVGAASPQKIPFDDWRDCVRLYPSAWNKLYRRDFIGGLRFDIGTLYEDHAFFLRLCAKCNTITHLREPLYQQSMQRAGQITGDGSERVFQQFDVLDTLTETLDKSDRPGAHQALSQLATRVLFERANVIEDPERLQRFFDASCRWLQTAAHSGPDTALAVPRWWADRLNGAIAFTVIIDARRHSERLPVTLASISGIPSHALDLCILTCADTSNSRKWGSARVIASDMAGQSVQSALLASRGDLVLLLKAGDVFAPGALTTWFEQMWASGAAVGLARHSGMPVDYFGLADRAAVLGLSFYPKALAWLAPQLSATLFRRSFLFDASINPGSAEGFRAAVDLAGEIAVLDQAYRVEAQPDPNLYQWGLLARIKRALILGQSPVFRGIRYVFRTTGAGEVGQRIAEFILRRSQAA